jgi:hypothetical protein
MTSSMRMLGTQSNQPRMSLELRSVHDLGMTPEFQLKSKIQKRVEGCIEDIYKIPRVIDAITSYLVDVFIQKK